MLSEGLHHKTEREFVTYAHKHTDIAYFRAQSLSSFLMFETLNKEDLVCFPDTMFQIVTLTVSQLKSFTDYI